MHIAEIQKICRLWKQNQISYREALQEFGYYHVPWWQAVYWLETN